MIWDKYLSRILSFLLFMLYIVMKKLVSMYIWLLVYLIIGGAIVFHGYYQEHLYYVQMLGDGSNWLLLLW